MQVGRQKSRFWAYIWLHCLLLTLQQARCCQYDAAGPPSRKLWQLSLVVSGGVDSGKRRRSVYDKKPQRYAKDNRTAHLTARSDKSVAYVTNNKRVLDFCTRSLLLLTGTTAGLLVKTISSVCWNNWLRQAVPNIYNSNSKWIFFCKQNLILNQAVHLRPSFRQLSM